MAKPHRELFDRLGPAPVPAVLIDTPYGFQSNAEDISARAVAYFRETVGRKVEVASLLRAEGASPVALEAALAGVGEARWVFTGPGSPTYALRQWRPTVLPRLLADKLAHGGCLVFSSAAALTLGRWTVPVYEIYKVGADPVWEEGLDLLSPLGLNVAVIPHYDNAEGGTHDTRYCYLGEQRLRTLEAQLPPGAWVLGVDEHTVCVLDCGAGTVTVAGLGHVTARYQGRSVTVPSGTSLGIAQLTDLALGTAAAEAVGAVVTAAGVGAPGPEGPGTDEVDAGRSLTDEVKRLTARFDAALAQRDAETATAATLELESALHAWSADTYQSDEVDRARAALRRMVLRLGELASPGLRDPREMAAPWVEALLSERVEARQARRFADADRVRDVLSALHVEVRDSPGGTEWDLRPGADA
jgi:sorbitol-specific phosphotransferase system component IIA